MSKIYQKNEQGDVFWDTYLHPECTAVCYGGKEAESKDNYANAIVSVVYLIEELHNQGDISDRVFERLRDCIDDGIIK